MLNTDLHTHTIFSDGKDSPEEMARAAFALGMKRLGFSDHSFMPHDQTWCMKAEDAEAYKSRIADLKKQYAGRMEILCGIEQDLTSGPVPEGYDYAIGSVHHVFRGARWMSVDHSPEDFQSGAAALFAGDYYALAEAYYEAVARVIEVTGADIIGHFDLVSKFNEGNRFFDESHPRYVAAWQKAADALLKTGKPFEINMGAIARGYRTTPYPSASILAYLKERGATFILSSDAHQRSNLCYQFDRWANYLEK